MTSNRVFKPQGVFPDSIALENTLYRVKRIYPSYTVENSIDFTAIKYLKKAIALSLENGGKRKREGS